MKYGPQELAAIHGRMQAGDLAGALVAIDGAVEADPNNASAWHLAGVIRRRAGQSAAAANALEKAVAHGLANAELFNSLGLAWQDANQRKAALAAYDKALEEDARYEPAAVNRARLLTELGRWRESEQALRDILAANPGSSLARNALAATLRETHRSTEAADESRKVLEREPANKVATIRLGQALCDIGDSAGAVEHYGKQGPNLAAAPEFQESFAAALVNDGQTEAARQRLEQLVAAAPAYFPAHRALARLGKEFFSAENPYASYRALVTQWPQEPSIWIDWLSLLLSFREHDMIVDLADEASRHVGRQPAVDYFRGIALSELGRATEAETLFAAVEAEFSTRSDFLIARARNALRLGQPDRTEALASQVTSENPRDQFGWAYLSLAWRLQDDPREFWLHDYETQVRQSAVPHLEDAASRDELVETLRGIHKAMHHPPDQTLRGGTQTMGSLFTRQEPSIARLRESILGCIADYSAALPDDREHPFYSRKSADAIIKGSWSVRLKSDGFHVMHLHEQGWVSSALHLVLPPADGEDPTRGALVLGAPPAELELDLEPRRVVAPEAGKLVLFPSSMWHGTIPFQSGAERLTVAFDAVPAA